MLKIETQIMMIANENSLITEDMVLIFILVSVLIGIVIWGFSLVKSIIDLRGEIRQKEITIKKVMDLLVDVTEEMFVCFDDKVKQQLSDLKQIQEKENGCRILPTEKD